jgi:hypothetical protein
MKKIFGDIFINVSYSDSTPHMNVCLGMVSLLMTSGVSRRCRDRRTSKICGILIAGNGPDTPQDKVMVVTIPVKNFKGDRDQSSRKENVRN